MKYKMIVSDMDDTLLRDDFTISSATKEAIIKAQEQGIKFVLCTGRPTYATKKYAEELFLHKFGSYIISYNGAVITDMKTRKEIYKKVIPNKDLMKLSRMSNHINLDMHTYINDEIVTENDNKFTRIDKEITGMPIRVIESFDKEIKDDVVKVLMLQDPLFLKTIEKDLQNIYKDKFSITISKPYFLDFMPLGVNKGNSLGKLASLLKIEPEEIIAIGDSYNDKEMLSFVGMPVCVENAHEEIKKKAKFVTSSNNDDGVRKVIEELIFKDPAL